MNKYNTDYLSIMPDDDVFGALNAVRGKINHITRTKNANTDLDALQVEYCYLIRETDLSGEKMNIYYLNPDDSLGEYNLMMKAKKSLSSSIDSNKSNTPRTNIIRTANGYRIDVAIPGFSRNDFIIVYEDSKITISIDKADEISSTDRYVSREFNYNSFNKTWTLKTATNAEQIDAMYNSGILTINIPTLSGTTARKVIQVS